MLWADKKRIEKICQLSWRGYPLDSTANHSRKHQKSSEGKHHLQQSFDTHRAILKKTSSAILTSKDHSSGIQLRGKFLESFTAKISPYISCKLGQQNSYGEKDVGKMTWRKWCRKKWLSVFCCTCTLYKFQIWSTLDITFSKIGSLSKNT